MRIVLEKGLWETDFLLKEILPKGEVSHNLNERGEVLIFASRAHSFNEILSIVEKLKPKIDHNYENCKTILKNSSMDMSLEFITNNLSVKV